MIYRDQQSIPLAVGGFHRWAVGSLRGTYRLGARGGEAWRQRGGLPGLHGVSPCQEAQNQGGQKNDCCCDRAQLVHMDIAIGCILAREENPQAQAKTHDKTDSGPRQRQ
jgi:hypothetical protein